MLLRYNKVIMCRYTHFTASTSTDSIGLAWVNIKLSIWCACSWQPYKGWGFCPRIKVGVFWTPWISFSVDIYFIDLIWSEGIFKKNWKIVATVKKVEVLPNLTLQRRAPPPTTEYQLPTTNHLPPTTKVVYFLWL